jgi:hypothetical protein
VKGPRPISAAIAALAVLTNKTAAIARIEFFMTSSTLIAARDWRCGDTSISAEIRRRTTFSWKIYRAF